MKRIYLSSLLAIIALTSNVFAANNMVVGKQQISRKAVLKTIETYKSMPAPHSWNLVGDVFYKTKAGFLQCINNYTKITTTDFAYCCGISGLGGSAAECVDLVKMAVDIHNDMVRSYIKTAGLGNVCSTEDLKTVPNAAAGRYSMINGVYKCVATECKTGYYLKKNAKGESQGWCAYGTDPYVPFRPDVEMPQSQVTLLNVEPLDAGPINIQLNTTVLADDPEFAQQLEDIQKKADAEKVALARQALADQSKEQESQLREQGKQLLATQKEELKQEKKINRLEAQQEKLQQKIDANTQEQELQKQCDELKLSKADCAKYKKNPDAFLEEREKEQECERMGLNKTECAKYYKDPDAYLAEVAKEAKCKKLNLNAVEFNKCKKDPVAYQIEWNEREIAKEEAEKLKKDKKKDKADKKAKAAALGLTVAEYERYVKNEATLKQLKEGQ
jgi:hypothetical protein